MSALAAIHVGLKQLGIEAEDARDLYERQTGKRSLREMSAKEQEAVIGELRRLGFKPASKGARKRLEGRFAKKFQALWIAAWNLGLVRNPDDEALIAFVKRQTGIDHVRFVRDPDDAAKAIEALKSWMAREAGVDWTHERLMPGWTQTPGYRIATAQFAIVKSADPTFAGIIGINHWLVSKGLPAADRIGDAGWREAMNALGVHVRALKAEGAT